MACTVKVFEATQVIIVDGVSFNAPFKKSSIEGGHPQGPLFTNGSAKAVISDEDAAKLISAGVIDRR
jgi:hypothetical protein